MAAGVSDTPIPLRVRYKAPILGQSRHLVVSGYGVELALKRTDYIVIDDRDAEDNIEGSVAQTAEVVLEDTEDIQDLKPLSSSELFTLGIKAASYIVGSNDPFDTFAKISQDFPKYASALASSNLSTDFVNEHRENRDAFLPPGYNLFWMNGIQVDARKVDAYSLLEQMRRERKFVTGIQELGFTAPEAISILSHPEIAEAQNTGEAQRYDYRDEPEGGKVIIWLNDIERDKRYAQWPEDSKAVSHVSNREPHRIDQCVVPSTGLPRSATCCKEERVCSSCPGRFLGSQRNPHGCRDTPKPGHAADPRTIRDCAFRRRCWSQTIRQGHLLYSSDFWAQCAYAVS